MQDRQDRRRVVLNQDVQRHGTLIVSVAPLLTLKGIN